MPPPLDERMLVIQEQQDFDALQMLKWRREGWAYREIADAFGLPTEHHAFKIVLRQIKLLAREAAEDVRAIEVDRLDALLKGVWPNAVLGDTKAVDAAIKIMNRRAELLGLDAPAKVDVRVRARQMAIDMGADPDVAEQQAEEIIRKQFEFTGKGA